MAMIPESVKIDNNTVDDVQVVNVEVQTPRTDRNYFRNLTNLVRIELTREAFRTPSAKFFGLVTNEDGRLKVFPGEVVLRDLQHKTSYTIKWDQGFIASWTIVSPKGQNEPALEKITIHADAVTQDAGGSQKKFTRGVFD